MLTSILWMATLGLTQDAPGREEESFRVGFRGGAVWAFAWGTASAQNSFTGFQRGEDLDLRDDFGLRQGGALADIEIGARFGRGHRVALHSLFGSISARTVLDRTFEYNDNVFQQNEHAQTKLEVDLRDADYAYRITQGPPLTLWAGAGGRWSHLNVGLRSTTLDPAGSMEENTAVFPTLNVALDYGVAPSLNLSLEVRGSPAAVPILFSHPSLGRFIEVRATLAWAITDFMKLEIGGMFSWIWQRWRGREADQHYAVNYVDILIAGPSIGLEFLF